MENNELKKTIQRYYDETDEDVIGVGYGYKTKGGKRTGEIGIIFTVKEKKPEELIDRDKVLPKTIQVGDDILITDVVQGNYTLYDTLCVSCPDSFYNWSITPPTNQGKFRPLKGGVSVTNYSSLSSYVGTMGFIGVDNETNSLVGVTNNHVLIDDAFNCGERNPSLAITNIEGDVVTQPNEQYDHGLNNSIGIVKKYYPISSIYPNKIDCALTTINQSDIDNESYLQEGLYGWNTYLDFATTQEINWVLTGGTNPDLYSSGRTTGAKGEGEGKLKINSIFESISIKYNKQGYNTLVNFNDCITFVASGSTIPDGAICFFPIAPGDSGSALIADINGTRKIIGLVFAGGSVSETDERTIIAIACRIDHVSNYMNISPWLGQSVNYSDTSKIEEFIAPGLNSNQYVDYEGKIFWQAGLVNINQITPTPTPTPSSSGNVTPTPTPTSTPTPTPSPSQPGMYTATVIRMDSSSPAIYRPHTLLNVGDYLYVSERQLSPQYSSVYKYNKNTLQKIGTITMSSSEGYGGLDTMCYDSSNDKLYLAKESDTGYLRIIEISASTFAITRMQDYNIYGGISPSISTDGTYIYGGTYIEPSPTIFKISISDLSLVNSVTLASPRRIHGSRIDTRNNMLYLTTIPTDLVDPTHFIRANLSDLTYDIVDISSYVKKATDDFAMIDDGVDVWCYVGGEYNVNGYNGVKIHANAPTLNSLALTGFNIKTTYGIFENGDTLYSTSMDGYIQVIDRFNLNNVLNYLVGGVTGVFNELTIDGSNRIFITKWSTSSNLIEIEF